MASYYQDGQLVTTNDGGQTVSALQPAIYGSGSNVSSGYVGNYASQGGGLTMANAGVDPMTGKPIPQSSGLLGGYGNLSAMNGGIVGNGAASMNPTQFYTAPGVTAPAASASSGSDAFFNSANAPTQTGQVAKVSASPNAGASYNTTLLNNLMASYQSAQTKSQADAQAQYAALMKNVGGYTNTINGLQDQVGAGNAQLIAQQGLNTKSQTDQDLTSRGLGNTTIRSAQLAGVDRNTALAQSQNASSIATQKIGTQMQLAQMNGDAILSKQVQAPSNAYLSLIGSLANR